METSNLANLEALLNIVANASEIIGIASGAPLLFGCWIPRACGLRGYTLHMSLAGIVLLVSGLAMPAGIDLLVQSKTESSLVSALVLGGICSLVIFAISLFGYFIPAIIAMREKKKHKFAITVLNVFSIVPIVWLALLTWACVPDKKAGITEI